MYLDALAIADRRPLAGTSLWWRKLVETVPLQQFRKRLTRFASGSTPKHRPRSAREDTLMATLTNAKLTADTATYPTERRRREANQDLAVAAAATGVSMTARLVYPPLEIAALPLMLALGVRPARRAYNTWRDEQRLSVDVAETLALALFVLPGNLLVGSMAFAAYHLGQAIASSLDKRTEHPSAPTVWVRHLSDQREVIRPLTAICNGDTIVVKTGEMIPLPGVVTEGTAWVRNFRCADEAQSVDSSHERTTTVTKGQRVTPAGIVQVGRLHICVGDA